MKRFEKYYGWIAAFIFFVAVIAVYKTFDNFSNITKYIGTLFGAIRPFILAFVIAYILNMPAKRLCKLLGRSKNGFISGRALGISIFTIYIISLILLLIVLRLLIPALYRNILDLYTNLPAYITSFQDYINGFEIVQRLGFSDIDLYAAIDKLFGSINMTQFGKYAQGVFNVTSGFFDVVVALIASIYMLIDKERLQSAITRIMRLFLKERVVMSVTQHARRINDIFTNYIYSRLICSIIMAIACSAVLMILKVRYALILGIFIGAMDMIPYFGSIISCVISSVVTLMTGGLWKAVWTAAVLLVLQQIDGNYLGPKIMGETLEIRPLWIIFAVSVGGTLFGFLGMLLSVPVLAIIRAICAEYFSEREMKMEISSGKESDNDEK